MRDDLQLAGALALVERAQDVAADAAVPVDADFDCHASQTSSSSRICLRDIIRREAEMREHIGGLARGAEAVDAEHAALRPT